MFCDLSYVDFLEHSIKMLYYVPRNICFQSILCEYPPSTGIRIPVINGMILSLVKKAMGSLISYTLPTLSNEY